MNTPPTVPSQMLTAMIFTTFKGHELSANGAGETKEKMKQRQDANMLAKMVKATQKAQAAKKGLMA
jgi:hypothetical protein